MIPTTILLKPTAFRKKMLMMNDVLPGVLLFFLGIESLGEENAHSQFAYLNILAGIAVILAFLFEVRSKEAAAHKLISKFDVIAGLVLCVEALNKHHAGRIFQPALFYYIIGIITIIRGLFHSRLPAVRRLIIHDKGFDLRVNLFKRDRMNWEDVVGVDLKGVMLTIKSRAGKVHTYNLSRVENREEVLEGLRGNQESFSI